MKQFLYLDNDIVASIIAQENQGLITQMTSQKEKESGQTQQESLSANVNAGLSGKLWKLLQANAALGAEGQTSSSENSRFSSKEIIEKTLHDAAFDLAYDCIKPNKADSKYDDAGDYIELNRVFTFVDLNYLEGLFSEDGVVGFLKKTENKKVEAEAEAARENYNRDQWRKISSEITKELKKTIAQNNKQYDDAASILRLIKSLVPYSRMLLSYDGYLVPLDEKYFRIDPANLGFKYGGRITCVGLITNIIGESTDPGNDNDFFTQIQFSANEVLRAILPTKDKDLCVVHPIAVYYGE